MKATNIRGDSLLHVAARQNRLDIFDYLLGTGLDPKAENQVGVIPEELLAGDSEETFKNKATVVKTKNRNYILPKIDPRLTDYIKKTRGSQKKTIEPSSNVVGFNQKKRLNFEEYLKF